MKILIILFFLTVSLSAKEEKLPKIDKNHVISNPGITLNHRENFPLTEHIPITPKVNVATGEYLEDVCDLVVEGSQPLSLRRFHGNQGSYDPIFNFWRYNPEHFCAANFAFNEQEKFVAVGRKDGSIVCYKDVRKDNTVALGQIGCISHSDLTGQSHPLNTKIAYRSSKLVRPGDKFHWQGEIVEGDGTRKKFLSQEHSWNDAVIYNRDPESPRDYDSISPNVWTPYSLPCHEERKPNGNIICYIYERKEKGRYWRPNFEYKIKSITAYNASKTKVLGQLNFKYHERGMGASFGNYDIFEIIGSDQRKVTNHINRTRLWSDDISELTKVVTPNFPDVSYGYHSVYQPRQMGKKWLNNVENPEGRAFLTEYDKEGRVTAQLAPVGPDGKMERISRYIYHNTATEHFDAENNKTIYHFGDKKRISCIQYVDNANTAYRVDYYQWDEKNGNLLTKRVEDGNGNLFLLEQYRYDKNHNVIEEKVGNRCQTYIIYRTYSDDGYNLKLSERDDYGKDIRYTYVPNTNLLSSEFTYQNGVIAKRIFHFYDDCAICIQTIIDDGKTSDPKDISKVTFRKIIYVTPKYSLPCFGLPICIEEKSLNPNGQEILQSKVCYTYTSFGAVLQEDHYDSKNVFQYSIKKEYDNRERLIATIDALGQKTTYSYDANNNLISCANALTKKCCIYDKANRPVQTIDSDQLTTFRSYDKLGRVKEFTNESGISTHYFYNSMGKVVTCIHPDGIEKKEYDVLGNVIRETDARGHETQKTYNFRGQRTAIFYPNGSHENFTYRADGKLIGSVDKNGAKKTYFYDIFGHAIEETTYSSKGEFLRKTTSEYSPFHQLSVTDAMGAKISFSYDFSGKKISQTNGRKTTYFEYDSLGRLISERLGETISIQIYDKLNRVVEKRVEDLTNQVLQKENYTYDVFNNKTKISTSKGITETIYNAHHEPIQIKDPSNNITKFSYAYKPEKVTTITNPKGIKKRITFDARGRKKEIVTLNLSGDTLHKTSYKYDSNSNEIETKEEVYQGTLPIKTLVNTRTYDKGNQILSLCESGLKTTKYQYDEKGRLIKTIKPNATIKNSYDELGRLITYSSSDFSYCYSYDLCDRLLSVSNGSKITTRTYDSYGNLCEEVLETNLAFKSEYDEFDRRRQFTLPDQSSINYSYQNGYLYEISRNNLTYTYAERDREGCLTKSILPQNLGTISLTRDSLSRWKDYTTPFYESHFPSNAYDSTNNLLTYTATDSLGEKTYNFAYDTLDQLITEREHTYAFDSLNNRLIKDGINHIINQLNQITDQGYTYDSNGNMLTNKECTFTYDSLDRLIEVRKKGTIISYTYDPFHRRLSKTISLPMQSSTVYYLWDGNNEIGAIDEKNAMIELRILGEGLGAEIGAAVLIELQNKPYLPIHDHRGCLATLIDIDAKIPIQTSRYTAFGEELTSPGISPWRFSSKRYDEETGFLFFGRRYYAPDIGRWITTDPQGFHDGPNLYAYVHNNPLTHFDLYGLFSNPYEGTRNLADFCKRTSQCIFEGIHALGQHAIPIPVVRDAVEAIGRFGTGGKFWENGDHHNNYNRIHIIPGIVIPDVELFHMNGVKNPFEEACKIAEEKSKLYGGVQVVLYYNGSQGLVTDLIHAFVAKLGIKSPVERMVAHHISTTLAKNPNTRFIGTGHSQAGTHLKNVGDIIKPDMCKHIELSTFGSATLVPKGNFRDVVNHVSLADLVPMSNPIAWISGLTQESNTYYHKPSSFLEHGIDCDTYWNIIKQNGQDFKEKYYL